MTNPTHPSAFDIRIVFGKYGPKHPDGAQSLGQMATSTEGRSYLNWLSDLGWSQEWRDAATATLAGEPVIAPTKTPVAPQSRGKSNRGRTRKPKIEEPKAPPAEPVVESSTPPLTGSDEDRIREIAGEVVDEALPEATDSISKAVSENVSDKVQAMIDAAIAQVRPDHFKVSVGELPEVTVEGIAHEAFADLMDLAVQRVNMMMIGPAGCGKTFIAEQIANALSLRFGSCSLTAGASEGHLTGRLPRCWR